MSYPNWFRAPSLPYADPGIELPWIVRSGNPLRRSSVFDDPGNTPTIQTVSSDSNSNRGAVGPPLRSVPGLIQLVASVCQLCRSNVSNNRFDSHIGLDSTSTYKRRGVNAFASPHGATQIQLWRGLNPHLPVKEHAGTCLGF